jgi:protein-disulfide isomerase
MSPRRTDPKLKKQATQAGLPNWVIAIGIGVVAIAAVFVLFNLQTPSVPAPVSGGTTTASGRTKGDPNAKVELTDYSDFQWPICQQFATGAGRQIDANYVQTSKVKFTYKYYPVVDFISNTVGESHWAAYAAECANQQGKFWEYHDKLFGEWRGENVGTFTKPNLKKYATDLGLDAAKFNPCLDNDSTKSIIDKDIAEAQNLGIQGTPTFLINGRLLNIGATDYAGFTRTFDTLLK